jgi:hypothetical protein
MKKKQAKIYSEKLHGYLPHPHLWDIFTDEEEIPFYLIRADYNRPVKSNEELVRLLFKII